MVKLQLMVLNFFLVGLLCSSDEKLREEIKTKIETIFEEYQLLLQKMQDSNFDDVELRTEYELIGVLMHGSYNHVFEKVTTVETRNIILSNIKGLPLKQPVESYIHDYINKEVKISIKVNKKLVDESKSEKGDSSKLEYQILLKAWEAVQEMLIQSYITAYNPPITGGRVMLDGEEFSIPPADTLSFWVLNPLPTASPCSPDGNEEIRKEIETILNELEHDLETIINSGSPDTELITEYKVIGVLLQESYNHVFKKVTTTETKAIVKSRMKELSLKETIQVYILKYINKEIKVNINVVNKQLATDKADESKTTMAKRKLIAWEAMQEMLLQSYIAAYNPTINDGKLMLDGQVFDAPPPDCLSFLASMTTK